MNIDLGIFRQSGKQRLNWDAKSSDILVKIQK